MAVRTFKRLGKKHFGQSRKVVDVVFEYTKYPKSITDNTYFIPTEEETKTMDKSKLMSHDPSMYDFNGESGANFEKIARMRKPGKDITELTEIAAQVNADAEKALANDFTDKVKVKAAETAANKASIKEIATGVAQSVNIQSGSNN